MKRLEISATELNDGLPPPPTLILLDTIEITNRSLRASRNNKKLQVSIKYNRVLQDNRNLNEFALYYTRRGFDVSMKGDGVLIQW